ncbi:MAG: glycosyltransferase family 4 protein [Bacteroidota bacterium]
MITDSNNIVILASWSIDKVNNKYFIPHTHYIYLTYICRIYTEVVLISPTRITYLNDGNKTYLDFQNLKVIELPYFKSYIESIRYFFSFYSVIKSLKKYQKFYCRVPDPFSWLPSLFFNKKCILHFVGDPIDSILKDTSKNIFEKTILILLYIPDFILIILACRRSKVYTNGYHLSKRLSRFGIKANSLISSTLTKNDFSYTKKKQSQIINLIYLGYLRYPKGIQTILNLIILLEENKINFKFTIIGDGQMRNDIESFINKNNLSSKVKLLGHINDRCKINEIFDMSDFFIFPSKSEGSPRVILEAMSRMLPVISTPVGSLPYIFQDNNEILFAEFDNPLSFYNKIIWALDHPNEIEKIKLNAFLKVKNNYTMDKFLTQIFK